MPIQSELLAIKRVAKKAAKANPTLSHAQHLDRIAREQYGVGCYHELRQRVKNNLNPADLLLQGLKNPLPGLYLISGLVGTGKSKILYDVTNALAKKNPQVCLITDVVEYRLLKGIHTIDDLRGVLPALSWPARKEAILKAVQHTDANFIAFSDIRSSSDLEIVQALCQNGGKVLACIHAKEEQDARKRIDAMSGDLTGATPLLLRMVLHQAFTAHRH